MIDFYDDDDDSQTSVQTEDDRLISEAKIASFREMQKWIEKVTNKSFSYTDDFRKSLSDGILLCNLLNCLKPGSIKRINKISTTISGYEHSAALDNIGKFLRVCEEDFGLSSLIMFETSDLEDLSNKSNDMTIESDRRLCRVLICLFHLAKSVENQLTKEILDPRPFSILLQSQDHKVMRRLKSQSLSSDTHNDNSILNLIKNQNPNYLASLAQETLIKTQLNQSILHRSVDDEEWQESLENWREKRRQVISNPALDDNVERNGDNQELLDLKEKARRMKLQRDQLKDQSIVALPLTKNELANGDNQQIPDIDEETKAMIERVKQKKLEEENKRRFSLSPPLSAAFASDSELSTSTAVDKHDDDTMSTSEKHDPPAVTVEPESNISMNDGKPSQDVVDQDVDINDVPQTKGRIINVKLTRRSKQDNDQCWGMELSKGINNVVVTKVKIGSCADVCEVRKGDEIVKINSEDVSKKSVEYVRSLFNPDLSLETVTLSLKRTIDEEEDEDLFNSDQSDINEYHMNADSALKKACEKVYQPELCFSPANLEESGPKSQNDSPKSEGKVVLSNVINTCETPSKEQELQSVVERIFNYKGDSSFPMTSNPLSIFAEEIEVPKENDFEKENERKLSVQEKIANIESKNAINSIKLSSSWNTPKTCSGGGGVGGDPLISKMCMTATRQSTELLSSNSEDIKTRQGSSGHSSLSNLYHYWETEAPKSISSVNTNIITKSVPLMQTPINSVGGEHNYKSNIEMEIAEQHLDTSNVNIEETWKTVNSSENSCTSDDISPLHDTFGKFPYNENESVNELQNSTSEPNYVLDQANGVFNQGVTFVPEISSVQKIISSLEEMNDDKNPYNSSITNTSTGVQADLAQPQKRNNYTTVTTSFENRNKSQQSLSTSRMSDDDTCSMTISNNQNDQLDNCMSSVSEFRESSCQNLHSIIPYSNDLSKDYTTITAVTKVNRNPRKEASVTALSTESSVTGVSRDKDKSVEIEVSVTPQLFPIRNKTLLSKAISEKEKTAKLNEVSSYSDSVCVDENTLLVTDLDEVITPVKHVPQNHAGQHYSKDLSHSTTSNSQNGIVHPRVEMKKAYKSNVQIDLSIENEPRNSSKILTSDNKSQSLRTTVTTDPSMSIISVPTMFRGEPKSDNTLSRDQIPTISENNKSKKSDAILSSKKIKKCHTLDKNSLSESKRSSSTKELRFEETSNDKEFYDLAYDNNKRRSSFLDDHKHNNIVNNDKYSEAQSFKPRSNFSLPSTTNIMSHIKTYSIERPVKQVSFTQNPQNHKKNQKPSIPKETKTSMKCNYCSSFVGLEDLMVIEELNLHFHLRCFICNECKQPLGDGKSDTDVRIRRSKLHCLACYNKKSSKSKHRQGCSGVGRTSQSMASSSQNKGGLAGEGRPLFMHATQSNNCADTNITTATASDLSSSASCSSSSNNNALSFAEPSLLEVCFADTF